ncbi:hypothetical protein [Brevibacterium litoralis]|uniref:hypothetical protein n=1 Tax=Brevibacterium litoralis TaxID=3138935 RepID=UPI0032EDBAD9
MATQFRVDEDAPGGDAVTAPVVEWFARTFGPGPRGGTETPAHLTSTPLRLTDAEAGELHAAITELVRETLARRRTGASGAEDAAENDASAGGRTQDEGDARKPYFLVAALGPQDHSK